MAASLFSTLAFISGSLSLANADTFNIGKYYIHVHVPCLLHVQYCTYSYVPHIYTMTHQFSKPIYTVEQSGTDDPFLFNF